MPVVEAFNFKCSESIAEKQVLTSAFVIWEDPPNLRQSC